MLSRLKSRPHHFTGVETEGLGGNHLPNVSAAHSDLLSSTRPVEYSWNCTQRTPGLEAQFAAGGDIWEAEVTSGGGALLEEAVCWVLGSKCFPDPPPLPSCHAGPRTSLPRCSRCHDRAKATTNQNSPSLYLFLVSYLVPEMRKGSNTSPEKLPLHSRR